MEKTFLVGHFTSSISTSIRSKRNPSAWFVHNLTTDIGFTCCTYLIRGTSSIILSERVVTRLDVAARNKEQH
jgi:hypothetical protein